MNKNSSERDPAGLAIERPRYSVVPIIFLSLFGLFMLAIFMLRSVPSKAITTGLIQSNHRIYANQDSLTPGAPLAADNAVATMNSAANNFRVRIGMDNNGLNTVTQMPSFIWDERVTSGQLNWYAITSSSDGAKLAAVVNSGLIYTSVDYGATWTSRASSRAWDAIAGSSDGTKLVAAVNGGAIYTSSDSGATWTAQPGAGLRSWFAMASSSDGAHVAAAVTNGYIYTSTTTQSFAPTLQSAPKLAADGVTPAATCAAVPAANWFGVTNSNDLSPSPITYNANPSVISGSQIAATPNDPAPNPGYPYVYQTYASDMAGFKIINNITPDSAGLWDVSLVNRAGQPGVNYCFRIVDSDGTVLSGYQNYPEISLEGILSIGIVDSSDSTVANPNVDFAPTITQAQAQTTLGTLGTNSQKIRITNNTLNPAWGVSVAATNGTTAKWSRSDNVESYSYNNQPGVGFRNGQLSVDPLTQTITPSSGCDVTGINAGSGSSFQFGSTDAITLTSATAAAAKNCYWDVQNISLSQVIPVSTAPGTYSINLTLTVMAQ